MAVTLVASCGSEGYRCEGQMVQQWMSKGDFGNDGDWETTEICSDGTACEVRSVAGTNFDPGDIAFCAAPAPECDRLTGRRCADDAHMFTCVDGDRLAEGALVAYPSACPADRPHCVEPEPGLAFCVADPAPNADCANQPAASVEVCLLETGACTHADVALACVGDTWVACLDGIEVDRYQCGAGTCSTVEKALDVYPCQ